MPQKIISGNGSIKELNTVLTSINTKKFMLVCDTSFPFLSIKDNINELSQQFVSFSEFTPNPLYEDVVKGVDLFCKENCDAIVAVGGGSTIDVAKCIKLFCKMDSAQNYLKQEYKDSGVPLIAIPTTAGTGSESTRYSVIYFEGQKQSVTHESIVPNYAFLEASVLKSLSVYQKKCTMLDALCQGIESWWSVNSTDESKRYTKIAVETIIANYKSYIFDNEDYAAEQVMLASNYAGRAINITQTTAAHAMSYKITSMYNLPHGHAVAVCLPHIWKFMVENLQNCVDHRGSEYLSKVFKDIALATGSKSVKSAIDFFHALLSELEITYPSTGNGADINVLTASVNPTRLKNNPVFLNEKTINALYTSIIRMESEIQ